LTRDATEGRLLVSVGGDGTLLDASKKVRSSPVLGVNSDTSHSMGFLCAANGETFAAHFDAILAGRFLPTPIHRIQGDIDGAPFPHPVLNDVLIAHKNPAATSKYILGHGGVAEDHKSSGVWICTAAGSTAAMGSAGGDVQLLGDERVQVRVREPFVADRQPNRLDHFFVAKNETCTVVSKMREGRVYLDGPYSTLELSMGARLTVHSNAEPLMLFVTPEMAERRRTVLERQLKSHPHAPQGNIR
jgi:NAD+ kinase